MFLLEHKFHDESITNNNKTRPVRMSTWRFSEGPKILVAEKGVLASRSWMVHHNADGVHVVSLDDDGWPRVAGPD